MRASAPPATQSLYESRLCAAANNEQNHAVLSGSQFFPLPVPGALVSSIPIPITLHKAFAIFALVILLSTVVVGIAVVGVFILIVLFGAEVFVIPAVFSALNPSIPVANLEGDIGRSVARTMVVLVGVALVSRAIEARVEAASAAIVAIAISRLVSLAVAMPVQFVITHIRLVSAHRAVIIPALVVVTYLRAAVFTSVLETVQVAIAEAVRICALWASILVFMRNGKSTQ